MDMKPFDTTFFALSFFLFFLFLPLPLSLFLKRTTLCLTFSGLRRTRRKGLIAHLSHL